MRTYIEHFWVPLPPQSPQNEPKPAGICGAADRLFAYGVHLFRVIILARELLGVRVVPAANTEYNQALLAAVT
jgi:hypothetical protein